MTEVTTKTKFQALYIEPECRKKIQYWADAASGEVSGLGIVENIKGQMIVKEVFILEQECSGTDTELNPESISKLMTELMQTDKDPSKLKFWWHSHVNMGVFWSGTDDECAETLSKEFAFSTVVNKKGESKTRLDLYEPFRITVDNIRLIEVTAEDEDLKKQCEQDVKDKVKEKTWGSWKGRQHDHGYFDRKSEWGGYGRGMYHDPYDYDDTYRSPKSKVKLSDDVVDDIKLLEDFIFDHGFKPEALQNFYYDLIQQAIKREYKDKAECRNGVGTFDKDEALCKNCKISKQCCVLTEKFEEIVYEESDIEDSKHDSSRSIEVIVDCDD